MVDDDDEEKDFVGFVAAVALFVAEVLLFVVDALLAALITEDDDDDDVFVEEAPEEFNFEVAVALLAATVCLEESVVVSEFVEEEFDFEWPPLVSCCVGIDFVDSIAFSRLIGRSKMRK